MDLVLGPWSYEFLGPRFVFSFPNERKKNKKKERKTFSRFFGIFNLWTWS